MLSYTCIKHEVYYTRGTGEGRVQGCQPPHSPGSNSRGIKVCEHRAQVSALANACRLARVHQPPLPFLRLAAYSGQWVARQLASSVLPQNASQHSSPRPITAGTVRFRDQSKFISFRDALRGHDACLGHATSPGCSAWLAWACDCKAYLYSFSQAVVHQRGPSRCSQSPTP